MTINLNKIKGLMAEHGDTQASLAEKLNISKTTVNYMLSGKVRMSLETATKIAQMYAIKPLELIAVEE